VLAEIVCDDAGHRRCQPSGADPAVRRQTITAALAQVTTELDRLVAAVASGGDVAPLIQGIRDRETRRDDLLRELETVDGPTARPMAPPQLMQLLEARLADWKGLLRSRPVLARQMIRKLVVGRFTFVADLSARCYRFKAIGTISNLLNGLVDVTGCPIEMASPTGFEPVSWP
jgi:hypothetical protein